MQINFSDLPTRLRDKIFIEPNSGCWLWLGYVNAHGYGTMWWSSQRPVRQTHPVIYEFFLGPVPPGLELDHLCRTRSCCNPCHLEPVTRRTNLLRGDTFAARKLTQTHCERGHLFDDKNTYYWRGRRHCRLCRLEHQRQLRLRRKQRIESSL